jgi:hypothetical protein
MLMDNGLLGAVMKSFAGESATEPLRVNRSAAVESGFVGGNVYVDLWVQLMYEGL